MSARGEVETYLHWLQWRLGHALADDLMTPDQAVAWHELCRQLRLAPEPLAEDVDEAILASAGAVLDPWLEDPDCRGLWVIGPARTGVCTLLHDLVLGLCGPHRAGPRGRTRIPIPLLICGNATRVSICMLGLTGPWHGLSAEQAIDRWWSAVELDLRRHVDRTWRAGPLRGPGIEPLVILGGVDELRDPGAQQTVLGWAGELSAANIPIIVSSRDAELPELDALCEPETSPMLRRVHVLPLARPPIDRFLGAWARVDGAFNRVAPERLKAAMLARPALVQLARRPAELAILTVLSSGADELPETVAELHRAMLGALDLGQPAHRQLLARVVADPDSALDMPTRRAWLAALVAVSVACDHVDLGEALGRDVRLGPTGAGLLLAATRAWAEGGCPLRPVLADSPVRVPRSRCQDGHDDEMARLIWLGHHAGWWGPEAIFVLRRAVPARERLVDQRPSSLRPRPLLLALAALDAAWGPSALPLLRALPLGLLLAEGGTLGPVTAAALYADNPPGELRPVRETFHRFLELELALVSLAADDTTLQAIVMEMAASRDLDLDGALDLVLAQEGVGPRRPRIPGAREDPSERGAYLDLALNLAARLTPCGAPALVADLERARNAAIHYSDCFTGALRTRLEQLAGFLIVLLVYAIDRRLLHPARPSLRRAEVFAMQQMFSSPERVAAGFAGERRAEVADDWRWVMRQPWAPHRIAGHLLARMPETLDLDPDVVLPRCHAWLRAWLAQADVAA